VALHLFTDYCRRRGLAHPEIDRFTDHLWRYLTVRDQDQRRSWEADEPSLIKVGLGSDYPAEFDAFLTSRGVSGSEFRQLVACTAEILIGQMYGAADDEGTQRFLSEIWPIVATYGVEMPNLKTFESSRWLEDYGWGAPLSSDEVAAWRNAR
jgi:hypothetical protein